MLLFAILWNVLLGLVCIAGLVAPFLGVSMLRKRADIKRTPVRPVSTLDSCWTATQGRAVSLAEMIAPFSGKPCVYYEARVELLTGAGQGKYSIPMWQTHAEKTTTSPFYVQDDTGKVLVSTMDEDSIMDVPEKTVLQTASETTGAITRETPVHILESLERMGIPYLDEFDRMLPLKYTERCIEAGSDVYVLGRHSRDAEDVTRALADAGVADTTGIRSVITRNDAKKHAYVSIGDQVAVPRKLLWQAVACICLGPLATAAAGGFLYVVYFVA